MSFDLNGLKEAVQQQQRVARVLVLNAAGSVPRDAGTEMLVWADGQSGTIGGGALEFEAARAARAALDADKDTVIKQPLGPALAQCCGGSVTLLTEIWDAERLADVDQIVVRPLPGHANVQPLSVARSVAQMRNGQGSDGPNVVDSWVVERVSAPTRQIWIYGAGHVGRAIVSVLAPMPSFEITWLDTSLDRFPEHIPEGVRAVPTPKPADAVQLAPHTAEHFVLTYSHGLDLEICHRLLSHGFATAGVIGSATKWARFRKRLQQLGHDPAQIERISCPIGDPSLGKHPQAIAVSIVSGLLSQQLLKNAAKAAGT